MNRNQRILYDIPMSMTTGRSRRVRRLGRRGSTNRLRLGLWRCGGSHWGPTTEIWNARRAKQRLGVDRDLKTLYDIPIVMTSGRSRRDRRLGRRGPTIRLRLGLWRCGGSYLGPATEIWNARGAKQRLSVDRDLKTLYDIPIVMTIGRSRWVRRLGQRGPTIRLRLGFRRGGGSHRGPARSMRRKWSPNSAIPAKQTLLNLLFISTQTIAHRSEKHVRHNQEPFKSHIRSALTEVTSEWRWIPGEASTFVHSTFVHSHTWINTYNVVSIPMPPWNCRLNAYIAQKLYRPMSKYGRVGSTNIIETTHSQFNLEIHME
jgi:hypothetical protein